MGPACGPATGPSRQNAAPERSDLEHIFQKTLPFAPWMTEASRRLPGVQPLKMTDWLVVDDAFAGQMAARDRLLSERRADVLAPGPSDAPAAELLALILAHLGPGYRRAAGQVTRPDGVTVRLDGPPLLTAARLVQEDLCILEKPDGAPEHVLTAAALCFPASWTLAEKIGHPLSRIHAPVSVYDADMAPRVQRLFDRVHPERPLWRQNALLYADPALYHPRTELQPRVAPAERPDYLRSERQCILRLWDTGAVVFSIHTWVLPFASLTAAQLATLKTYPIEYEGRT